MLEILFIAVLAGCRESLSLRRKVGCINVTYAFFIPKFSRGTRLSPVSSNAPLGFQPHILSAPDIRPRRPPCQACAISLMRSFCKQYI